MHVICALPGVLLVVLPGFKTVIDGIMESIVERLCHDVDMKTLSHWCKQSDFVEALVSRKPETTALTSRDLVVDSRHHVPSPKNTIDGLLSDATTYRL